MSSNCEIKVDYSQVGALLKGTEMKDVLEDIAGGIQKKCGSGYTSGTKTMGTRVIASVITETDEAMQDNSENNTILKAL